MCVDYVDMWILQHYNIIHWLKLKNIIEERGVTSMGESMHMQNGPSKWVGMLAKYDNYTHYALIWPNTYIHTAELSIYIYT